MKCTNCDKPVEKDSKFCQFCGTEVKEIETSKTVPVEKELISHLEFLGYVIEDEKLEQRVVAKHKNKSNLIFNAIESVGTSFLSMYIIDSEKVGKNRLGALELVNRMNNQAVFVAFSLPEGEHSFMCSALYVGKYNKEEFAAFIDMYETDIQSRLRAENFLEGFN